MVDDGSTDGSAAIAEAFADRDPRFRLVTRPTAASARRATPASTRPAASSWPSSTATTCCRRTPTSCCSARSTSTGSDFATGNVHRLTRLRHAPVAVPRASAFARDAAEDARHASTARCSPTGPPGTSSGGARSGTRTASRFPEGRVHEDIPVIAARALPGALGRRDLRAGLPTGGSARAASSRSPSARLEPQVAARPAAPRSRRSATSSPSTARASAKRWYDESVVADDLRYYLNVARRRRRRLPRAVPRPGQRVPRRATSRIYEPLPAIERLKWHLVRRRLMPELLEVLRFQREDLHEHAAGAGRAGAGTATTRSATDRAWIPRSVYRLDAASSRCGAAARRPARRGRRAADLRGWAYIDGHRRAAAGRAAASPCRRCRRGRLRRVRLRIAAVAAADASDAPARRRPPTAARRSATCVVRLRGDARPAASCAARGRWRDGHVGPLRDRARRARIKRRRVALPRRAARGRCGPVELPGAGGLRARSSRTAQAARSRSTCATAGRAVRAREPAGRRRASSSAATAPRRAPSSSVAAARRGGDDDRRASRSTASPKDARRRGALRRRAALRDRGPRTQRLGPRGRRRRAAR